MLNSPVAPDDLEILFKSSRVTLNVIFYSEKKIHTKRDRMAHRREKKCENLSSTSTHNQKPTNRKRWHLMYYTVYKT